MDLDDFLTLSIFIIAGLSRIIRRRAACRLTDWVLTVSIHSVSPKGRSGALHVYSENRDDVGVSELLEFRLLIFSTNSTGD